MRKSIWAVAATAALASIVAACGAEQAIVPRMQHGAPLAAGPKPTDAECAQLIRADTNAAKAIRTELRIDGLPATDVAVGEAAADLQSDLSLLGIPVRAGEVAAVKRSGMAVELSLPIAGWTQIGAPERFGGLWIDPPGSNRYVVAIVASDPRTLALARCLERGLDVRYVHASRSLKEGRELQERITNDWDQIRAAGIEMNSTGYLENRGVIEVTVSTVTEQAVAFFRERYGDAVEVVQGGPAVPG